MATLQLTLPDGRTASAQVDDSFATLSPEDQEKTVNEIVHSAPQDTSYWSAMQAGAHDAMSAGASLAKGVGGILQRNNLPGADTANATGDFLNAHTPGAPANFHNRGADILSDLKAGNYSQAAGDVLHGVAYGAPVAGAAIGAGAAADAVGIPTALAAGAVTGGLGLGAGAQQRATAAGRQDPNTADMVGALPRAAVDAAAGGVQLGRVVPGLPGRIAAGAGAGGAQAAADQYDQTGTIDPEQVANAAITGGATSAALEAPGVARSAIKAGSDHVMARTLEPPATTEDAASVRRVNTLMDQAKDTASNTTGRPLQDTQAANNVKQTLTQELTTALTAMALADRANATAFQAVRDDAINLAQRHNNTVTDATFAKIDSLPIDDTLKQQLADKVRDLNTVSTQSFKNAEVGPMRSIGGLLGRATGLAAGAHFGPAGIAAALIGGSKEAKIGQAVGGAADRMLGTNTPTVRLQDINAQRILARAGIKPSSVQPSGPLQVPQAEPPVARNPAPPNMSPQRFVNPAPGAPAPAPGFIRPPVAPPMAPPARPAPGFIRPQPAPPAPGTGPDPTTGLGPDPIPVNTPIPAGTPRPVRRPPAPLLRPNTAADVAMAHAQDDMAPGSPQVPPHPPQQVPAMGLPGGPQAAPGTPPGLSPALRYIGARTGHTPEQVMVALQAAEQAGAIPQGSPQHFATSAAPIDPATARVVQSFLPGSEPPPRNQGYAVEHSHQARINAREYQDNARAAASIAGGDLGAAIIHIAQGAKTPAAKQALAAQYIASHPAWAGKFPDWLINHGRKD